MNARNVMMVAMCFILVSCAKQVSNPRAEAFANLPDWRGIWFVEGEQTTISGFPDSLTGGAAGPPPGVMLDAKLKRNGLMTGRPVGFSAPWNDAGEDSVRKALSKLAGRKADGWGYPLMMAGPAPLQFVVTPEEVLIVNSYHEVRQVYTDRQHSSDDDRWPTTWGESIGHWEGDTLVIDTISVRNPNRFIQLGPPLSDEAHYVERLRKTGPDRIESELTIDDPTTLTKPWVSNIAYVRTSNMDRLVPDAFDNDRSELEGGAFTIASPKQ